MKTTTANIQKFPELFGRVLCEKLGWEVKKKQKYGEKTWWYRQRTFGLYLECKYLASNLYHTHEAELQVIETVGHTNYAVALYCVMFLNCEGYAEKLKESNSIDSWRLSDKALVKIATASASERLCACLLALNVLEVEDTSSNLVGSITIKSH